MARRRPWLVASLALCVLVAPASADEWRTVSAEADIAGAAPLRSTHWQQVRPPGGVHDRIGLHRYRAGGEPFASFLYLPGTNMNGRLVSASERHELWLFLAARGVEVFALDYRTHAVVNDPPPDDLAFMRGWTMERFVEDAQVAAAFAREQAPGRPLFVGGFSRGASLAFALACVEGDAVAGLVVLDGVFKAEGGDPTFDRAAALAKLEASGVWASDVAGRIGWEKRAALMQAAAADPSAPPLGERGRSHESVGAQVAAILYGAWRPGALANPVDGVSRVEVLARLLAGYDRFYPRIQNVEGQAIAAVADDPSTPLDDAWGELALPILYFGATGMGPGWILDGVHSAVRSGSEDVELHVLEGFGHLDVLVGETSRELVFEPTLRWMKARAQASP